MSIETVMLLLPELTLIALATLIYLAGAFRPARGVWGWVAIVGLMISAAALSAQTGPTALNVGGRNPQSAIRNPQSSFGPLALDAGGGIDRLGGYARWLALAAGMVLVLTASRPGRDV